MMVAFSFFAAWAVSGFPALINGVWLARKGCTPTDRRFGVAMAALQVFATACAIIIAIYLF